jgi:hypothetical protein
MKKQKRIYVHSPAYTHHNDNMLTAVQYKRADAEHWADYFINFDHRTGQSLLANSFNLGWQGFVNATADPNEANGGPYDYFLLIASDVEPNDNFMHLMVEELELHKYAALGCVVAIKDNRGMTSTAVGQISNRWTEARKLTMTEVDQLPLTFGVEECLQFLEWKQGNCFEKLLAHPEPRWQCDLCLLPNTGCLLIKMADWCWEFPGFEIRDQFYEWHDDRWLPPRPMFMEKPHYPDHTELSKAKTPRKCSCVPEDWNFGRWMARMGLRVGATSKVRTYHYGVQKFGNDSAWGGEKFDHGWAGSRDIIGQEPLPLDKLNGRFVTRLPANAIQGHQSLTKAEGVMFDCPKCKGDLRHPIICWFIPGQNGQWVGGLHGKVRPGCWEPRGTGIEDLTLSPAIAIEGGCGWCGRIENGKLL